MLKLQQKLNEYYNYSDIACVGKVGQSHLEKKWKEGVHQLRWVLASHPDGSI